MKSKEVLPKVDRLPTKRLAKETLALFRYQSFANLFVGGQK